MNLFLGPTRIAIPRKDILYIEKKFNAYIFGKLFFYKI
jgi:hypothetical protein